MPRTQLPAIPGIPLQHGALLFCTGQLPKVMSDYLYHNAAAYYVQQILTSPRFLQLQGWSLVTKV